MKKKTILLCLVIALMATSFIGCSKDANTLRISTNAEFPPWENLEDGKIVGFDADFAALLAEKLGMEYKFYNMKFESVIAAITAGTSDIAISALTITESRKKSVDFSVPYYQTSQILMVRSNDTVFTGTTKAELDEQLKNKKVGVCEGYTGVFYAEGAEGEDGFDGIEGADIKVYSKVSLAAEDLKNGNIDVIIMDDTVAKEVASSDTYKDVIKVIDVALTTEYYAVALKKGNTELKDKIDKAINELKAAGKLDELFDKWEISHN